MPLYIPNITQAGYWFHLPITIPEETPVELVIEAEPHEIKLDAQTKIAYCMAISRALKKQKPDQQVSCANVQQQLDSREYTAPCYSLQCVGYDLAPQEAFVKALTLQLSGIDTPKPS
ncbi:hypothetical protein EDD85DRAFT_795288 [Armillaria nabsnona]|nr:hypothetical protein EDD85DRAFT_795288 [Armillaria nabsnona]